MDLFLQNFENLLKEILTKTVIIFVIKIKHVYFIVNIAAHITVSSTGKTHQTSSAHPQVESCRHHPINGNETTAFEFNFQATQRELIRI